MNGKFVLVILREKKKLKKSQEYTKINPVFSYMFLSLKFYLLDFLCVSISGSETKFEVLSVAGRHWIGRSGRFSIKYFNLPFIKLFLLWESSHTIHRNTKTFSFVPGCLHCRHYMLKKHEGFLENE